MATHREAFVIEFSNKRKVKHFSSEQRRKRTPLTKEQLLLKQAMAENRRQVHA